MEKRKFSAVVIGVSAGGSKAMQLILPALPANFPLPIIIIQHISAQSDGYFIEHLNSVCEISVKEAAEKEKAKAGTVYFCPPNYHLLVEEDGTFSLSTEGRVNYARPAIDVLFETAAYAYGHNLIGIILTGANSDGSQGLKMIKEFGGFTIVQDPKTAEVDSMPLAAITASTVDKILPLNKIAGALLEYCMDS
ncbi:MAG: chemotaxis protein CheB [Bacteroidetes bacterium 4484_276]|nr:MAG: chemotaxis protein CheB [Bacteroidetes bacterium 4484_276]